jgi:hypothetical protein
VVDAGASVEQVEAVVAPEEVISRGPVDGVRAPEPEQVVVFGVAGDDVVGPPPTTSSRSARALSPSPTRPSSAAPSMSTITRTVAPW